MSLMGMLPPMLLSLPGKHDDRHAHGIRLSAYCVLTDMVLVAVPAVVPFGLVHDGCWVWGGGREARGHVATAAKKQIGQGGGSAPRPGSGPPNNRVVYIISIVRHVGLLLHLLLP
eukprot:scaffold2554_cov321-Prasinococcus_capsulatus_cf.AAC.6